MKKRFIILIDFSEYSENLIRYACDWARMVDAELLLLHKTTTITPGLADVNTKQQIAEVTNEEALSKLKVVAENLIPPSMKTSFVVTEGHLQTEIDRLVSEQYDNLVFTGLKGTGKLKKIFIGSVTLHVIEDTNNIVVAMPREISTFSQDKLFVAVTDKHPLNVPALDNFLKFIQRPGLSLTFFHLAKPEDDTQAIRKQLEELASMFSSKYKTSHVVYEGNNSFEEIKNVISDGMDQLLIIQKGSRLLVDQLFRKMMINNLVYEGKTPLIVMPS